MEEFLADYRGERDEILAAVGNAATQLMINDDTDSGIRTLLQELGRAMSVCRVYSFEQHRSPDDISVVSQRYEWVRDGISSQLDNDELQNLPVDDPCVSRLIERFKDGRIVFGDVDAFPSPERVVLEAQGILSILLVPVFVRADWWGFIGFDSCRMKRTWDSAAVDALRIAASLVGASLCRQQMTFEVEQSEARFRTLLDNMPSVAVQGYGPDGRVHYWNKACETMYGYTQDEAIDRSIAELIIPPQLREYVRTAIAEGAKTGIMPPPGEHDLMHKNGNLIPVLSSHACIKLPNREPEMFCIDVDLRALKQTQDELKARERAFKTMAENSPDSIARFDREVRHLYVNRSVPGIVGLPPERWIGKTHAELGFAEEHCRHWKACIENTFKTAVSFSDQSTLKTDNGDMIINWHLVPEFDKDGNVSTVLSITQDITPIMTAQKKLADAGEQLRRLRQHAETIRDDEQKQITQRIHDDFGQRLTTLTMNLTWLRDTLQRQGNEHFERLNTDLRLIEELLSLARDVSMELRPSVLDHFGLPAALEWAAENLECSSELSVELNMDEELVLPKAVQSGLYRISQELLTNIIRHADASSVQILLMQTDHSVCLSISDDGAGMVAPPLAELSTMGLMGIRETAMAMGAQVEIGSSPGCGTTISVTVPTGQPESSNT